MGDKLLAASIICLTCHFIFNVIISGFAGATEEIIFKHQTGKVSDNHTVQITPAGRTFMIWNLIYIWLFAAYVFRYWIEGLLCVFTVTVNVFRSSWDGPGKRYSNPTIFGRCCTVVLIASAWLYTSWLFVWDNQLMTLSAIILGGIAVTNWIAVCMFSVSLWKSVVLLKTEAPVDLILYRVLVQNGFAVYATWTTLAFLINMAVALAYDGRIDDPVPSLIALSFLVVLLAVWTPLEVIFWDNYFRYMITPFYVLIWGLSGIYVKQSTSSLEESDAVRQCTCSLIAITCGLAILRVTLCIYRHIKRPLYIGLST